MSEQFKFLDLEDAEAAKLWLMAFKATARAKNWTDEGDNQEHKRQITDEFMGRCGLKALATIVNIVSPKRVEDMQFSVLCQHIENFIQPKKKLVVAERAKFYERKQLHNESVTQFLAALRKAAVPCEFIKLKDVQDPTEEMVKLGLISGILDSHIKQKFSNNLKVKN